MSVAEYFVLILILAVFIVLVVGVVNMLRGGDPHKGNRLMMWRVGLQAAVIFLAALFLAKS